jgi:hypothetical protein
MILCEIKTIIVKGNNSSYRDILECGIINVYSIFFEILDRLIALFLKGTYSLWQKLIVESLLSVL